MIAITGGRAAAAAHEDAQDAGHHPAPARAGHHEVQVRHHLVDGDDRRLRRTGRVACVSSGRAERGSAARARAEVSGDEVLRRGGRCGCDSRAGRDLRGGGADAGALSRRGHGHAPHRCRAGAEGSGALPAHRQHAGLRAAGLHCYDGHNHITDSPSAPSSASEWAAVEEARGLEGGNRCRTCRRRHADISDSRQRADVEAAPARACCDFGYGTMLPDMDFPRRHFAHARHQQAVRTGCARPGHKAVAARTRTRA